MRVLSMLSTCAAAAATFASGCSVPDGDDVAALEHAISLDVITPDMRLWAANRFTVGYIKGLTGNVDGYTLGWVECPGFGRKIVEVREMWRCLNTHQSPAFLYEQCLSVLLAEVKNMLVPESTEGNCHWDSFMYGFAPDELPDECDPDNNGTARAILDAVFLGLPDPPPPAIQAAMAAGALFGPAGALCVRDTRGCPGAPWETPGTTPSPGGSAGGDR